MSAAICEDPERRVGAPAEPSPNTTGQKVAVITVFPTTSPESAQTTSTGPAAARATCSRRRVGTSGAQAYVGGLTAIVHRHRRPISDRLPYFIGAVVLLSFLLLMLVFHSILVPLTAAVMNLLSVGAAYGVTVAVFQWGWAQGPHRARQHGAHRARSSR